MTITKTPPNTPPSPTTTTTTTKGANGSSKRLDTNKKSSNNNNKYPSDWPQPDENPIDLSVHDLPHASSSNEWWYLNAHVDIADDDKNKKKKKKVTASNKEKPRRGLSVFVSFFRRVMKYHEETKEYEFTHSITWSLMDKQTSRYYNFCSHNNSVPKVLLEQLRGDDKDNKDGDTTTTGGNNNSTSHNNAFQLLVHDKRLHRAFMEVLEKGTLPYPDRLLENDALFMGRNLTFLPANDDTGNGDNNRKKKSTLEMLALIDEIDRKNRKREEKTSTTPSSRTSTSSSPVPSRLLSTHDDNSNNIKKDKKKSKNRGGGGLGSWCCCKGSSILKAVAHQASATMSNNATTSANNKNKTIPLLQYDDNTLTRNSKDGSYDLYLTDPQVHNVTVQLHFVPQTKPIRNGNMNGIVDGDGIIEDMFYYSLPNCTVTGTIVVPSDNVEFDKNNARIESKNFFVRGGIDDKDDDKEGDDREEPESTTHQVSGIGWYDHQFGRRSEETHKDVDKEGKEKDALQNQCVVNITSRKDETAKQEVLPGASWTWLCLQLVDIGYQICCSEHYIYKDSRFRDNPQRKVLMIIVDPKGETYQVEPSDFTFQEVGDNWVSMRTFREYPVKWEVRVPSRNIHITVEAAFEQQEFQTLLVNGLWEGCVDAKGTFHGLETTGKGVIERSGFSPPNTMTLDYFFKCVSRETLKSVQNILPLNPKGEKLNELVSRKENTSYTEYIDSEQYSKALVEPIRVILDRGGKSWRSYATLACCDLVGGNSQKIQDWLALPELMHAGSLIVDDVEDKSLVRRGGPCAHLLYGEDVAINAGSYCYFLCQMCVYQGNGDPKQQVDIYNLYFDALRAAHSGQAMDIHGLDYMMNDVVEHGGDLCRQRVIAIHRLKSAVPASALAGMGCTLGGGSKEQSKALSDYFEALGIAFQIVDDVLNLKGFRDGLKTKGEDITAGKVTYPVAKAMSHLEKEDRAKLWEIVSAKTEDIEIIGKAIALIGKVNAIDESYKEAKDIMEVAWKKMDPLFVDSYIKQNLRAFCWYVLDRTY